MAAVELSDFEREKKGERGEKKGAFTLLQRSENKFFFSREGIGEKGKKEFRCKQMHLNSERG